jgi:hypothetical protein
VTGDMLCHFQNSPLATKRVGLYRKFQKFTACTQDTVSGEKNDSVFLGKFVCQNSKIRKNPKILEIDQKKYQDSRRKNTFWVSSRIPKIFAFFHSVNGKLKGLFFVQNVVNAVLVSKRLH